MMNQLKNIPTNIHWKKQALYNSNNSLVTEKCFLKVFINTIEQKGEEKSMCHLGSRLSLLWPFFCLAPLVMCEVQGKFFLTVSHFLQKVYQVVSIVVGYCEHLFTSLCCGAF